MTCHENLAGFLWQAGKKRKILVVAVFPVIAVLWLVGWTLFWTGQKPTQKKERKGENKE